MSLHPLESEQIGLKALEKQLIRSVSKTSLSIGIPKERSVDERRVSLTPTGVSILCANGHEVVVEADAGVDANFKDSDYSESGAVVLPTAREVYERSNLITKVGPPDSEECEWIRRDQVLLSAIHLGNIQKQVMQQLIRSGVTALGYEYIRESRDDFPLVRMMHEITGSIAVQVAAHYLEATNGGPGIMLGGISGVPPATVVILGAGIIGEYAAMTALGYGAQVFVLDDNLTRLRHLENALDRRIITAAANAQYLSSALASADVVIGAAMKEGDRSPVWVSEPMVARMKQGSVIVDTVIDQGGCIATSHTTTHSDPVYELHGVTHYCVPNIPSNVPQTATQALNNVIVPYLLQIGDVGGIQEALWQNEALRSGTYIHRSNLTKKSLARQFDLPYREIDSLIASRL